MKVQCIQYINPFLYRFLQIQDSNFTSLKQSRSDKITPAHNIELSSFLVLILLTIYTVTIDQN